MSKKRIAALAVAAALAGGTVGCGADMDYNQRADYLTKTGQRGAEAHERLKVQGAKVDKDRCEKVYVATVYDDIPSGGIADGGWRSEVKKTFVEACLSGNAATPAPSGSSTPTG
ncbi:hypothetical protein [Micromonospora maritima]|uniref:hypothetical protein n=1 Tax=Micromonospora maritima TaxID=986711 RepID=UPI00157DCFF4|nr:hypothetical protein [Micromonospora maritima]